MILGSRLVCSSPALPVGARREHWRIGAKLYPTTSPAARMRCWSVAGSGSPLRRFGEFGGLEFEVTPEVLDPRADSETVVTAALEVIGNRAVPLRVLDMGTGTGCLLLALLSELPNARGLGVDVSPPALEIAQANSVRLEFSHRTKFAIGNWGEGLSESFD